MERRHIDKELLEDVLQSLVVSEEEEKTIREYIDALSKRMVKNQETFFVILDEEATHTSIQQPLPSETSTFIDISFQPINSQPVASKLGRYVDLGQLGIGGMGEVRKVKDNRLNRVMAMKIIHRQMLSNKDSLARFIEEAQVGAQLQHPNIVPVYELGELPDGRYYFTMKEIKGESFNESIKAVHRSSNVQQWIPTKDGLRFRNLIQIFHKICLTIAYAHSSGVIHRDLKPENVMIGDFGEVLVVDWGIAKVLRSSSSNELLETFRSSSNVKGTVVGMVAGTPSYMSPEQAMGNIDEIDNRADIYTLGAILYEILSGQLPYNGDSVLEILDKVKTTSPPSLKTGEQFAASEKYVSSITVNVAPKIPDALADICHKAMQREIQDRYPNVEAMADDILAWLEGDLSRETALEEVKKAEQKLIESKENENEAHRLWLYANQSMTENGWKDTQAWDYLQRANIYKHKALKLHREYLATLQASLVYDCKIEEANVPLAENLMGQIIDASTSGNLQKSQQLKQDLTEYLANLSDEYGSRIQSQLKDALNNDCIHHRSRYGKMVGRKKIINDITLAYKSSNQLVTLVGPAGVGKTRLALEICHILSSHTNLYLCDVTGVTDELGLCMLVANTLGVSIQSNDPKQEISRFFAAKSVVLILDNVGKTSNEMGELLRFWMSNSNLQCLITSRIHSQIIDESVFVVEPLTALEAMELFVLRGKQWNPSLFLSKETRETIWNIVTQLDNLPMAIELAAARLNIFTVDKLAERLKKQFSLLRSQHKNTPTLQSALNWSWDLLPKWGRSALAQLSIFRRGFDITAAEAVLQLDEQDCPPIVDILQELCDNSLLYVKKSPDGNTRYVQLESISQFGITKLSSAEFTEVGRKHADYYCRYGRETIRLTDGDYGRNDKLIELGNELENLLEAVSNGTDDAAALCCLAVINLLLMKGPAQSAITLTDNVLMRTEISNDLRIQLVLKRARCLVLVGRLDEARKLEDENYCDGIDLLGADDQNQRFLLEAERLYILGDIEGAQAYFEKALGLFQQALDIYQRLAPDRQGQVLNGMAIVHAKKGDLRSAQEIFERALFQANSLGNILFKGKLLSNLGNVYDSLGDLQKALSYFHQAHDIFTKIENTQDLANVLGQLSSAYNKMEEYSKALAYRLEALEYHRTIGNKSGLAKGSTDIGSLYESLNQTDLALEFYQRGLTLHRSIGNRTGEAITLGALGALYAAHDQIKDSIEFYRQSITICEQIQFPAVHYFRGRFAEILARESQFEEALDLIRKSENGLVNIPFRMAFFLCNCIRVYQLANQPDKARMYFKRAQETVAKLKLKKNHKLYQQLKELEDWFE